MGVLLSPHPLAGILRFLKFSYYCNSEYNYKNAFNIVINLMEACHLLLHNKVDISNPAHWSHYLVSKK